MLITRSGIPIICHYGLSKACVIGVRYSLYRTQFKDTKGAEIPILDYQIQQEKVLVRVAECFAHMFGAHSIRDIARKVFSDANQRGTFERLN
jgi:acyl-CoA oxidase